MHVFSNPQEDFQLLGGIPHAVRLHPTLPTQLSAHRERIFGIRSFDGAPSATFCIYFLYFCYQFTALVYHQFLSTVQQKAFLFCVDTFTIGIFLLFFPLLRSKIICRSCVVANGVFSLLSSRVTVFDASGKPPRRHTLQFQKYSTLLEKKKV